MTFIKKYICELVFAINIFLIPFNHDLNVWWQRPVVNDAMGYYVYLPAIFIHHTFNYDFIQEPWEKYYKYSHNHPKGAFVVFFGDKELNKYPPGVAYFQAPFFFMGHIWAKMCGSETDGYSDIYMYFLCIGAIFWQYVFLKLLQRIFRFYNLSQFAIAITAPLLSFGTNLWFYTQIFGTYSHLYTLLSISLFFYAGLQFFSQNNDKKGKYFAWMLIGFSLAIITRNINVIAILLLPCMGFKLKEFTSYLSVLKSQISIIGMLISFGLIFSMFVFWKIQTGHWLVDSYPDEFFNWKNPQIFKSLFSAHKGWFTYTPLALVGLLGLYYAPPKIAINFLSVLALVVYITSSWWCWDYGTAFSMRAYIDWYLFVSIGLGFLIESLLTKKIALYFVITICILFSAINILQSVQFMRGIISGSSQGIEYTIKNFFRLKPILEYQISKKVIEKSELVKNDFNDDAKHPYADVSEKNPFSKGIDLKFDGYLKDNGYTAIRYGAKAKLQDLNHQIFLCASLTNEKDSILVWLQTDIMFFVRANKWEHLETGFILSKDLPPNVRLKVFFWEPKGNTVAAVDDMYVEFIKAGIE
jgi:hypothetical protein